MGNPSAKALMIRQQHFLALSAILPCLLMLAGCDRSTGRLAAMVDVGGYELFLHCTGEGEHTLVMDIAAGAPSNGWFELKPHIRPLARVCVYDRAGLGASQAGPTPTTSLQIVRELHTLLDRAGVEPPFVMLGWSFGGLNMRLYAAEYPEQVAGLVLVDSSHPDQFDRYAAELPPRQPAEPMGLRDFRERSFGNPDVDLETSFEQVREVTSLGDLPLVVLSQASRAENLHFEGIDLDTAANLQRAWQSMQRELTGLSSRGEQMHAESARHCIHCTEPERVAEAIRRTFELIESPRASKPKSATPPTLSPTLFGLGDLAPGDLTPDDLAPG